MVLFSFSGVQDAVGEFVAKKIHEQSGMKIAIEHPKALSPFHFQVGCVVVEKEGERLAFSKIDFRIAFTSLFQKKINISYFGFEWGGHKCVGRGSLDYDGVFKAEVTLDRSAWLDVTGDLETLVVKAIYAKEAKPWVAEAVVHLSEATPSTLKLVESPFGQFLGHFFWEDGVVFLTGQGRGSYQGSIFEFTAEGSYDIKKEHFEANGQVCLEETTYWEGESLTVHFEALGSFEKPYLHFDFFHPYLVHPYAVLEEIKGEADLAWGAAGWQLTVNTEGFVEKLPFEFKSSLAFESDLLRLSDCSIALPYLDGSAKGIVDLRERIVQGSFSLYSDHVEDPALPVSGHLLTNFEMTSVLDDNYYPVNPKIQGSFDSGFVRFPVGQLRDISLVVDMDHIDEGYVGKIDLKVEKIEFEKESLENISFHLDFKDGVLSPFVVQGLRHKKAMYLEGSFCRLEEELRFFLEKLHVSLGETPLALDREAVVFFRNGKLTLDRLGFVWGDTKAVIQGESDGTYFSAAVDLANLNCSHLNRWLPELPLGGMVSGRSRIQGTLEQFTGEFHAHLSQFEVEGFQGDKLFPADGEVHFKFDEKQVVGQGKLKGAQNEGITFKGSVPWDIQLASFVFHIDPLSPLEFDVSLIGELAPFMGFLTTDTTLFTGYCDTSLQFRGSLLNPQMTGKMVVKNGSYESLVLGCVFQGIEAEFLIDGDRLICESIQGKDFSGGKIWGKGFIDLNPNQKYPFELALELDRVQMLKLDYAQSTASGNLTFFGDSDGGQLVGDLTLSEGVIRLPEQTPATLNTVVVEYINQPENEAPPTQFMAPQDPWPILLNISLYIPNNTHVISTNFHSEWKANVDLKGTISDPQIFGKGKVLEGSFSFNGKTFECHEGTIQFAGNPGRKTTVYIIARQQIDDLKIEIIVKGPIRSPELAFRSNPPKSTREILSWLLFNRGLSDISAYEGEELTQKIIKLNDQVTSSGPNLLDRLRTSFGIDRLDITGGFNDPEEMSLRVGKYLHQRLFFSVKKSMNDRPNQAAIEADLTHNFKAQAEVGDDAEAKLFLKWEKDY